MESTAKTMLDRRGLARLNGIAPTLAGPAALRACRWRRSLWLAFGAATGGGARIRSSRIWPSRPNPPEPGPGARQAIRACRTSTDVPLAHPPLRRPLFSNPTGSALLKPVPQRECCGGQPVREFPFPQMRVPQPLR
jgi:hypothetical protein